MVGGKDVFMPVSKSVPAQLGMENRTFHPILSCLSVYMGAKEKVCLKNVKF